jgi:uncharacterized protein YjbI with pentapeptide repeats
MANDEHVAMLRKDVDAWNKWRLENPQVRVNLSFANLREANLRRANLTGANLREADLSGAILNVANLREADLSGATLRGAILNVANLTEADLRQADLRQADLRVATLNDAYLFKADLSGAILSGAKLIAADLFKADLSGADLSGVNLFAARLVDTHLTGADLTGCFVYGVSAWGLKLEGAKQQNLIITNLAENEPEITVDNLEVAQFIYLMLNNEKVRDVIDTITSKAVLILGRFTDERKTVLDALREELRKRDYVPILFDFEVPARRNITETITLLARMARFIIADLTDPSSIPQELQAIIPSVRVPVQPLLLEGSSLYSMFKDFDPQDFHWVLPVYRYKEPEQLLATLTENVIAPAEGKVKALEERRRMIEAQLTKPQ